MDVSRLRQKYPVFSYESYNWQIQGNDVVIDWLMGNDKYQFHPQLRLLGASSKIKNIPKAIIDNFIFHLGLVEIFSYWKAFCSPKIIVNTGYLDTYQLAWWQDLLLNGMGQYFYENGIDFREKNFVALTSVPRRVLPALVLPGVFFEKSQKKLGQGSRRHPSWYKKTLIPVGGGKDSAVTLELLSNRFWVSQNDVKKTAAFVLNAQKNPAAIEIIRLSGIDQGYQVERRIDPLLLQLNKEGFLNGHTPFTAYLSFLGVFLAYLFGFDEVVFANERSANEGNVEYEGYEINHQYSKTLAFENKFRDYNKRYLSRVNYFSFLRPLYELQIMKIFSGLEKYFHVFLSCNSGQNWCGKCPKCLASFIGLYPFVEEKKLIAIFGKNLFSEENLLPIAFEMLGLGKKKPFECVGTVEETKIACYLSFKKTPAPNAYPLLKLFRDKVMTKEKNWEERTKSILNSWDINHNLPERYTSILKEYT
ncbi:hypothetical protein HY030_02830 [Candidatus Gottesmanbacteria bacterium]|nr:hypothetical protein [Candidatus Gottesmanbacteria bacterium]